MLRKAFSAGEAHAGTIRHEYYSGGNKNGPFH